MDGGEKDKNSSAGMLSCYLFISRYFMQLGSCLHKSLCIRLHTVCPRNLYPFYTVSFCSILYSKLYYKMDKYFLDIWYYQNSKHKTSSTSTRYQSLKTAWTISKLKNKSSTVDKYN